MSPNTMATYSISPATRTSFLPLLSMNHQNYISRIAARGSRRLARNATEYALLEDIHMAVQEKDLVDALVEKIMDDPTKESVCVTVFRARKEDTLQVTGHEYAFTFASLLVSWGKVVQSLNECLGSNFRVYPKDEGAEIVLYLAFKPIERVMNPEDEEEVIELPMRPRTSSIESE
jgi:hypothetical protein